MTRHHGIADQRRPAQLQRGNQGHTATANVQMMLVLCIIACDVLVSRSTHAEQMITNLLMGALPCGLGVHHKLGNTRPGATPGHQQKQGDGHAWTSTVEVHGRNSNGARAR